MKQGRSKDEDVVPLPSLISEVELKASHSGSPNRCSRGEAQDGAERRSGLGLADGEEPWFAAVMRENSAEAVTHAKISERGWSIASNGCLQQGGDCTKRCTPFHVLLSMTLRGGVGVLAFPSYR